MYFNFPVSSCHLAYLQVIFHFSYISIFVIFSPSLLPSSLHSVSPDEFYDAVTHFPIQNAKHLTFSFNNIFPFSVSQSHVGGAETKVMWRIEWEKKVWGKHTVKERRRRLTWKMREGNSIFFSRLFCIIINNSWSVPFVFMLNEENFPHSLQNSNSPVYTPHLNIIIHVISTCYFHFPFPTMTCLLTSFWIQNNTNFRYIDTESWWYHRGENGLFALVDATKLCVPFAFATKREKMEQAEILFCEFSRKKC